jgi:4-hydroxy-4-methyl-2-oxoglutarate aldolase
MNKSRLDPSLLQKLKSLNSCSVANAIETFHVRLRNTGFTDSTVHCLFPDLPAMVGYAVPVRVRTSDPPMEGEKYFYRLDWLDYLQSIPSPRILVMKDMDRHPGLGAFVGEVHVNILLALDCAGVVTNGAVRHVNEAKALQFQMFVGNLSVSHAFAHIFDFGTPVEVGHMQVQPGDLLHGDLHGVQTIPMEIADEVPAVVQKMISEEQEIIRLCRSREFSMDRLRVDIAALRAKRQSFEK